MTHLGTGGSTATPPVSVRRSYLAWLAATALYVIGVIVSVLVTFEGAGDVAAQDGTGTTGALLSGSLVFIGVVVLVLAALTVLFARKMRAGRSWARITLTVFGVIFALSNLVGAFGGGRNFTLNGQTVDTGAGSTVSVVVAILTLLLLVAALVLQWRPDTRGYFTSAPPVQAPPPATP